MTGPRHITYSEIPQGADGWILSSLSKESGRPLLYVVVNDREMERAAQQLTFFAPQAEIITFPAWDCLPYDRTSPRQQVMAERLSALSRLMALPAGKRAVIVTTVNAVTQKLPPRSTLENSSLSVKVGESLDRDALMRYLAANGYRRVGKSMEAGEFSLRGNIIDIYPSGYEQGCRIDLFGDEVESIRFFDPLSQRSGEKGLDALTLHPVSEVLLSDNSIGHFRKGYREQFGAVSKNDPLYESVSEAHAYPGMEHWLPLFYSKLDTLFDYVPKDTLLITGDRADLARNDRADLVADYYQARQTLSSGDVVYHPLSPEQLFILPDAWAKLTDSRETIDFTSFAASEKATEATIKQGIRKAPDFAAERKQGKNPFELLENYLTVHWKQGRKTLIACLSEGSCQRIGEKMAEMRISTVLVRDGLGLSSLKAEQLGLAVFPAPHGFETEKLTVISEQDVLGERISQTIRKKRRAEQYLAEAANFSEGELVVHREHGIGRFEGLFALQVNGMAHDCLRLIYAEDAKLFLPVENIDLISRYGTVDEESGEARLDKLGSASWQSRKARMKERIKIAAEELLRAAAQRELADGVVLSPSPGLYEEFVRRFPYVETEDQEKAIGDIFEDLQKGRPADRLICGDVGFGKTEVAMRAAFAAVTAEDAPMQVAVIAPTTLLARQHTRNFTERFEGFPITVRQLSRLTTPKQDKETLAGLADGTVDIVVGTHALLAERVQFKRLGVLIVDEEQHFGVKQKEKLKNLKENIHVFTLSATPIPRTMQLALSGVRELSLITTPPVDRLAVRTFVSPFDPVMIREALLREYHRGGQSFYVTPRIKDLAELRVKIRELAPEVKVAVAHGQMPAAELDTIMNDFYDGKFDVLLSTSIVESGLDVPTANTMIINRADRFGLSQLYQLRGRVGRSKTRAYCYLTLPHRHHFTQNALKRLEVMQTLDTLGAGFTVASHDMDIRGFGNLVGEEQSGHIREVGVELYQQMLEEAVNDARRKRKGEKVAVAAEEWRPQINLGTSVLIPETYVEDLDLRLGLYRRGASLSSAPEIEDFAIELIDRFGALPEEVEHFLTILKLKLQCQAANIERLDAGPKGIVISFYKNYFANPEGLLSFITRYPQLAKLRADHKLVVTYPAKFATTRDAFIAKLLEELGTLAKRERAAA